ncbi:SdrD B-like domain-containing protein [Methylobacterium marchantiae]|uniref:SdrD B-like domain-containing protein n=1 Tax=Methylobacterium marchantiae TaxID=600331 RepID=A0ABW3WW91_9HYPH|nr:hypothetical protein AIGOOFII_3519 [Methylobacterium marchantiae]
MAVSNASISGKAFFDGNADGIQNSGEGGVGNFTVDLIDANGTIVATRATDGQGAYSFGNLAAGTYSVQFHAAGGFRGNAGVQLANGYDLIKDVQVAESAAVTLDEGFYLFNNDVRGFTFQDGNGNGRMDGGETAMNGVKVQLLSTSGELLYETTSSNADRGLPGADGVYSFYNLKPGSYVVQMVTPTGQVATGYNPQTIKIGATDDILGFNQALRDTTTSVSLSGTAFLDKNGDGIQGAGEVGLAGASVVVQNSAGYAIKTTVADASGHYALNGLDAGNYRVTVATPDGLKATSPATIATGTFAAGSVKNDLDVGFHSDAVFNKTEATPQTQEINLILRGQSNSQYITNYGLLPSLKEQVEKLLGFDGINQKVNFLGTNNQPDGANTQVGATALTKDWLRPVDGDYTKGWNATPVELGLLSAIGKLSEAQRAAPTGIIYLHNEFDGLNTELTTDMWESAVRYEAGLVRGILGQDASTTPYLFVNAIAFPIFGQPLQPILNQTIRVGQTQLTEDKFFNAAFVENQSSDTTMNGDAPYTPGGIHMNITDAQQTINRIAQAVAEQFKASALPGSPMAIAKGDIDDEGPKVVRADAVAGRADQLLLTVEHDNADHMLPLNLTADRGIGWSIRSGYDDPTADAQGVKAEIVDETHIRITFDRAVPADGKVFYAWGGDRLAINQNEIGNGNAIYDDNGMPIWVDPRGLGVSADTGAPSLAVAFLNGNTTQAVDMAGFVSGDIAVIKGAGVVHGAQDAYNGTTFDVEGAWNSVKNVVINSETAQTLSLKDFVRADVTLLNTTGDSQLTVENLKQGILTTGGGDDKIVVSLLTNGGGSISANSGEGNDTLAFYNGNKDNAGTGIGNWLEKANAIHNGDGVQDGSTTVVSINAGSGDDVIDLSHVSLRKAVVTGGTGVDHMTASHGIDQFQFRAGDTGTTMTTADVIHDFDGLGGDKLNVYGRLSDWQAAHTQTADFDGTVITNTRDGAIILLEGVDLSSAHGWMI